MHRITLPPRPDWRAQLDRMGVTWYDPTPDHPVPYWDDTAAYAFTPTQIDTLKQASQTLTGLILDATGYAIEQGRLTELGIPAFLHEAVRASWKRDDPTVYMRLDLAYTGQGQPTLLEVNAQTPTSLIETAVCQWEWLGTNLERRLLPAGTTQWNTVHEGLSEQWRHLIAERGVGHVQFSSARNQEDYATVTYLRDLAQAAGASSNHLFVDEIGTSPDQTHLLDTWSLPIRHLMWLWPFEFAWESPDAAFLASTETRFIEPLWKIVTGSKGLLALLHELNPGHPNVLPATLTPGALGANVVRKPLFSREGQNVQLPGRTSTPGDYGDLPVVEQAYTELPSFTAADGQRYPVLGVWIAGDEVCGLGIREGRSRVTDNRASFVPHVVTP